MDHRGEPRQDHRFAGTPAAADVCNIPPKPAAAVRQLDPAGSMKRTETLRRRQHQVARRLVAPARHSTAHARLQGTAHTVLAALSVLGTIGHQLGNGAAMGCLARYPTQHGIAHAARHDTPRDGISRKTAGTKQDVVEGPGGSDSSKRICASARPRAQKEANTVLSLPRE